MDTLKHKSKARLGILGGMGAKATSVFYDRLTSRVNAIATCDQDHIDAVIFSDCSMPDRTDCILSGQSDELLSRCAEAFRILESAGCDAICFPCNTLHHYFDRLQQLSNRPLLNMVDLTMAELDRQKHRPKTLQVLGTEGTRISPCYRNAALRYGFELVPISDEDQNKISEYIYELKNTGRTDFPSLSQLIVKRHRDGIDRFILACTELSCMPLSHQAQNLVFDAMDALIDACVEQFGPSL